MMEIRLLPRLKWIPFVNRFRSGRSEANASVRMSFQ